MKLIRSIPYLVIVLTLPSIAQWMRISVGETAIWWLTDVLLLLGFYYYIALEKKSQRMPWQIRLFVIYVLFSFFYGYWMSQGYWDYKALIDTALIYLMCISCSYLSDPNNLSLIIRRWCYIAIVFFWILVPFMQLEAPGKFLVPFSFLLIFIPKIRGKWRVIVLSYVAIVFIFGTLGARSTALRFGMSAAISMLLIPYFYGRIKLVRSLIYVFFISPLLFFVLAISGTFNVFQIQEELGLESMQVKGAYDEDDEENLTEDTRTFLYLECIESSIKHNYYIQGHSLSRGYESISFGDTDLMSTSRGERHGCEVSILNIFTYMGLIGVILYFLVFAGAVKNVFNHSRNYVLYVMAVYVSFRWAFAWIEDFTRFDLNNLFLWASISMCYSKRFLNMTDDEICQWIKKIFVEKHGKTNNYIGIQTN